MHQHFLYFCTCACLCSNVCWQMSLYVWHTCVCPYMWRDEIVIRYIPQALSKLCIVLNESSLNLKVKVFVASMLQEFHLSAFWWVVIACGPQPMPGFLHVFWRLTHWSSHFWASVFLIVTSQQSTLLYGILFFCCFSLVCHHLLSTSK